MRRSEEGAFSFRGLDLNTAKTRMDPGAAQRSDNADYRRNGAVRIRPGYARLLSATGYKYTQRASDAFTTPDNTKLRDKAGWTGRGTNYIIKGIVGGGEIEQAGLSAGFEGCEYNAVNFNEDHYSSIIVGATIGAVGEIGSGAMVRSDATKAYALIVGDGDVSLYLVRTTWATPSQIQLVSGFDPGPQINTGDTLRLEAIGQVLYAYLNGTIQFTYDIASFGDPTAGRPGIYMGDDLSAVVFINSWAGGDIELGTAPVEIDSEASRFHSFERDDGQVKLLIAHGGTIEAFDAGVTEHVS